MISAILNSAIMDSSILHKKKFTHSFWLNLMMAAILNSAILDSDTAILDSDTLVSSLRFPQKHSHSILTLTETNSIWLKLIHSHSNWWWQPSWILPSWIQPFCTWKKTSLVHLDSSWLQLKNTLPSWIQPFWHKKNFTHSFSLNLMISAILNSAIMDSTILHQKNFTHSFWLNLMIAAMLKSAILDSAILHKKNFTHSFSLNLMIAAILNSAIMDSSILHQKKLHSFILTQLDDGSHLEICHVGFRHCHLGFRHLVIFSQIHSKTLFLHSELWLKLIQSD